MELVPWIAALVIYAVLFLLFARNKHHHDLMCVHPPGEIPYSVCISCEQEVLDLPDICFYTGQPHRLEQDA